MSLIAWYPLNGDTKDYSGNGFDTSNSGATVDTQGKIGSCYSFGGAAIMNCGASDELTKVFRRRSFSVGCWVKFNDAGTGDKNIFLAGPSGLDSHVHFARRNNKFYMGFYGDDLPSPTTLVQDIWYHVMFVWNNVTMEQRIFINGNLDANRTSTGILDITTGYPIYLGSSLVGQLNDVRIYDHVLSEKEIKELAKAKVLHYTFNDFQEPTTNLYGDISTSDILRPIANEYSTNIWTATFIAPPENIGRVYTHTSGALNSTWSGNSYGYMLKSYTYLANQVYTLSCWVFMSHDCNIDSISCSMESVTVIDYFKQSYNVALKGTWQKIQISCKPNVDSNGNAIPIYPRKYGVTDGSFTGFFAWGGAMLEQKDHATPFTSTSRTGTIKDITGYNNNAVLTEATTPQYVQGKLGSGGYQFASEVNVGGKDIRVSGMNWSMKSFTACGWVYSYGTQSDDGASLIWRNEITNFSLEPISNAIRVNYASTWDALVGGLDHNVWIHYAITYDELTTTMKLYKNGIEVASRSDLTYIDDGYNTIWVGRRGGHLQYSFWGIQDDIRIYATTLSSSDILEIVNTRAQLDDKGNLYLNEAFERTNIIRIMNEAIAAKTFTDGISSYQQSHCVCTLTNEGYRVYRDPNLTVAGDGHVMWGGMVLNIPEGTFVDGHDYQFRLQYKGVSSNGISEIRFAIMVGWSVLGDANIITEVKTETDRYASIDTGGKWCNMTVKITALDSELYKAATTTDGGLVIGQVYYNGTEFKIGHSYEDTGILGTDLTYRNLRLFDVTDDAEKEIALQDTGKFVTDEISEVGVTDGLVGYWKLDGDAKDYSGNNNNGAVTGAYVIGGIKNLAYQFDGGVQYINCGNNSSLQLNTSISMSAWINPYSVASNGNIVSKNSNNGFRYRVGSSNELWFYVSGNAVATGSIVPLNQWSHCVAVGDQTGLSLYLNGILVGSNTTPFAPIDATGNNLYIGCLDPGSEVVYGKITDVRIYDRALSIDEINILYKWGTLGTGMQITNDGTLYMNKEIIEGL